MTAILNAGPFGLPPGILGQVEVALGDGLGAVSGIEDRAGKVHRAPPGLVQVAGFHVVRQLDVIGLTHGQHASPVIQRGAKGNHVALQRRRAGGLEFRRRFSFLAGLGEQQAAQGRGQQCGAMEGIRAFHGALRLRYSIDRRRPEGAGRIRGKWPKIPQYTFCNRLNTYAGAKLGERTENVLRGAGVNR